MQDGRDEQPRGGATSALEDVRTKSAERFGRKSSDEPDNEPPAPSSTPAAASLDDSVDEVRGPTPSAPATATGDPLSEPRPTASQSAEHTGDGLEDSPAAVSAGPERTETLTEDVDQTAGMKPVEAEVRMSDGAVYVGTIHILEEDRVLDFLNTGIPFFALSETSGKVRLLSKAQVLQVLPYDKGTAASRGGGSLM